MIGVTASFTEKRNDAFDAFVKKYSKARGAHVSVGFHEGAGEYLDGVSVVQVALWNEFGTEGKSGSSGTPERSFIRSALDENSEKINQWREELIGKMMFENMPMKKALEILGERTQLLIQTKIQSNVPPPNAPATLLEKRKAGQGQATLIASGLMLRSVTWQVHE